MPLSQKTAGPGRFVDWLMTCRLPSGIFRITSRFGMASRSIWLTLQLAPSLTYQIFASISGHMPRATDVGMPLGNRALSQFSVLVQTEFATFNSMVRVLVST